MAVEATDVANHHGDLTRSPPAGAHLPVAGAIVERLIRHGSRVANVPATAAQIAHGPADRNALGLRPFAQRGNDLVAELDDLKWVALVREKEAGACIEDRSNGHLRDLGKIEVAEGAGGVDLLTRGGVAVAGEERVDVCHGQIGGAEAKFLQMLGQGDQEWDVVRGNLCSSKVQGSQSIGELGEQGRHISFLQQTEAGWVGHKVEVDEGFIDGRVVGQELNQRAWAKTGAPGQAQVGDAGSLRDSGKSGVVDLGVGEIEVGQVDESREEVVEHGGRDGAALVKREPFQAGQGHGQRGPTDQGLLEDCGKGLSRAAAEIHRAQVWQSHEQLPDHIGANVAFQMFLEQAFLQIGEEFQALQEGPGSQILDFGVHLLGATQADGSEVREVQATNECAESGILRHVVECLGEDHGVGEGHVSVQDTQSRCVQCVRSQKARNQIHVSGSVAIGWEIQREVGDDLVYES